MSSCQRVECLLLSRAQRAAGPWCERRVVEHVLRERPQEERQHRDGEGVPTRLQALPDEAIRGGNVVGERRGVLGEAQRPIALMVEEGS